MSLIWFLILVEANQKGIEVPELEIVMTAIFYIGDCIFCVGSKLERIIKQLKKGGV